MYTIVITRTNLRINGEPMAEDQRPKEVLKACCGDSLHTLVVMSNLTMGVRVVKIFDDYGDTKDWMKNYITSDHYHHGQNNCLSRNKNQIDKIFDFAKAWSDS